MDYLGLEILKFTKEITKEVSENVTNDLKENETILIPNKIAKISIKDNKKSLNGLNYIPFHLNYIHKVMFEVSYENIINYSYNQTNMSLNITKKLEKSNVSVVFLIVQYEY